MYGSVAEIEEILICVNKLTAHLVAEYSVIFSHHEPPTMLEGRRDSHVRLMILTIPGRLSTHDRLRFKLFVGN